jgi:antitoxin ParD1/3/4
MWQGSRITEIDNFWYRLQPQIQEVFPMNVSLILELDKFVARKVASGGYNSASEDVREALRLQEEHDRARGAQLAAFNHELGARLASLDRGEHVEPGAARGRLEQKSRERRRLSAGKSTFSVHEPNSTWTRFGNTSHWTI